MSIIGLLVLFIIIAIPIGILAVIGIIIFSVTKKKAKCTMHTDSNNDNPVAVSEQIDPTNSGIMRIRFETTKSGLMTASREQSMLEMSEKKATEWMRNNQDLEVISMTSTMG